MSNFDEIKKEMEESRNKAESNKSQIGEEVEELKVIEKGIVEQNTSTEFKITVKPPKKKKLKKPVNYYFSIDMINLIKEKAGKYNMKDSVFLEEILEQVLIEM